MARIQVLPLTTETLGSATKTPFVLIIDSTDDERDDFGRPLFTGAVCASLQAEIGAAAVPAMTADGKGA